MPPTDAVRWPGGALAARRRRHPAGPSGNQSDRLRHRVAHPEPMDRLRKFDRTGLIRASMLIFSLLALVSFALARVAQ